MPLAGLREGMTKAAADMDVVGELCAPFCLSWHECEDDKAMTSIRTNRRFV